VTELVFLSVSDVEFLHSRSIARFGGTLGLRDRGTLEAAVNQPLNTFYYGGGDLFDIAATYAFHVAEAQAFLDGNKRTAVAAALNFLAVNGVTASYDSHAIYNAMIGIAQKRFTKSDLAALLRLESQSNE
jgi:death on curing protein